MARDGASLIGARPAAALALDALAAVQARRGGVDRPALYLRNDNPWTDQIARDLRDALAARLAARPEPDHAHEVAARWRFPRLLGDGPVSAGADPLYDIAWRVYAASGDRMIEQPLVAECVWRGGWLALSAAADRLAQARAGMTLLCAADDPDRDMGGMKLAEACAFRFAAFAPEGEAMLLAFHQSRPAAGAPGFAVFAYRAGAPALVRV